MFRRFLAARLLWPTVFTLVGVALLIGLGEWQLDRLAWKQDLIAQIAERAKAAPVDVSEAEKRVRQGEGEYVRVAARGRFAHDKELYVYAPDPERGPGFHVYAPLMLDDGRAVFVNRGYVPEAFKARNTRPGGLPEGEIVLTGLARTPAQAGLFTPANNAEANVWFWRDLPGMTRAAFGDNPPEVLPFFVDAEAAPGQNSWPRGGVTNLDLPNRHLEYALTWFGLAATLAAVYAAFVVERLRRTR